MTHRHSTLPSADIVPRIVSLRSAVPEQAFSQQHIFDRVFRRDFGAVPGAEAMFCNVGVAKRHVCFSPAGAEQASSLTLQQRMQIWKQGVLDLGRHAVRAAIADAGRERIGSYITASCTGYDTPSPDMLLAAELSLPADVRRSFIGHVGCHAAFTAIKLALDALAARPQEAALVNCAEICSVHFRASDTSKEQIICQALFGDASAALVLAHAPEHTGPQVLATHTETLAAHVNHLAWSVRDDGFRMAISPLLPFLIGGAVRGFVERLLAPLKMRIGDVRHWGIHPGGPRVVEAAGRALELDKAQLQPSLDVLADYGNCSSATILLVLERLLAEARPQPGEHAILLGFGPGLTLEGLVLRF